jgi:hypothetical protein
MSTLWTITAIYHLISILVMLLCVLRLFGYTRRYKLVENKHTLLFGFISVTHVVAIYIFTIFLFTVTSIILLHYLSTQ